MSNLRTPITTFPAVEAAAKGRYEFTIAHNTTATRGPDGWDIRYHGNLIATLFPDGRVYLSSAGWQTTTTKDRLNRFAPPGFRIWQEAHVWFYGGVPSTTEWPGAVIVNPDGTVAQEVLA